jgi:asparagine N-glycosylation enzyme membrane subunit Stt3
MSIRDWLPQTIVVLFLFLGTISSSKGSADKTFATTIFGCMIFLGLLWWGGFFGR